MSEEPTRVQPPAPEAPPAPRTPARSWLSLVLAAACGFLLGALVLATVGGTDTVTQTQTTRVTVPGPAAASGGTVITKTIVPALVGEPLNVAKDRAERAKFAIEIDAGGGVFGVIQDDNWEVVDQRPQPGGLLEQGSTLHVDIIKR